MNTSLIYAYGIFWLAAISPGPDFAVTVKNSVLYGRKAGLLCALGVSVANGFHILYISFGLGALLTQSPLIYKGLQMLAALYLIYLGAMSVKASVKAKEAVDLLTTAPAQGQKRTPLMEGLLINLINPKAIIFWISYFSLVMTNDISSEARFLFSVLLVVSLFVWFSFVAFMLSQQKIRMAFLKKEAVFNFVMGVMLILLGVKVILPT